MASKHPPPEDFLPLKQHSLHVLIAVAADERHGYAIRKDVERRSEGRIRLWPTTLYRTISELLDAELLEDDPASDPEKDDRNRKLYRITGLGRQVLAAEVARLESVVRDVRRLADLLDPEGGTA
jgi:DNA-binding PadR family transcriptional regulator